MTDLLNTCPRCGMQHGQCVHATDGSITIDVSALPRLSEHDVADEYAARAGNIDQDEASIPNRPQQVDAAVAAVPASVSASAGGADIGHTPGPWCVVGSDDGEGNWTHLEIVEARAKHMAVCFLTSDGPKLANAHLISAAPDLLEALKNLGDWLAYGLSKSKGAQPTAEDHRTLERLAAAARAAVDKAEGK